MYAISSGICRDYIETTFKIGGDCLKPVII